MVVRAPLGLAGPQGQQRTGAFERLHLTLLVHAQDHRPRLLRRVEIQARDVAHVAAIFWKKVRAAVSLRGASQSPARRSTTKPPLAHRRQAHLQRPATSALPSPRPQRDGLRRLAAPTPAAAPPRLHPSLTPHHYFSSGLIRQDTRASIPHWHALPPRPAKEALFLLFLNGQTKCLTANIRLRRLHPSDARFQR